MQDDLDFAILDAMYIKTVIFLAALIAVTSNVRAGVISATWIEQGCGGSATMIFERDSSAPTPSDDRNERQEVEVGPAGDAGLAGVATTSGGLSIGNFALPGVAFAVLAEPELRWRLRLEDCSLPPSPVLSGLLKPS